MWHKLADKQRRPDTSLDWLCSICIFKYHCLYSIISPSCWDVNNGADRTPSWHHPHHTTCILTYFSFQSIVAPIRCHTPSGAILWRIHHLNRMQTSQHIVDESHGKYFHRLVLHNAVTPANTLELQLIPLLLTKKLNQVTCNTNHLHGKSDNLTGVF